MTIRHIKDKLFCVTINDEVWFKGSKSECVEWLRTYKWKNNIFDDDCENFLN